MAKILGVCLPALVAMGLLASASARAQVVPDLGNSIYYQSDDGSGEAEGAGGSADESGEVDMRIVRSFGALDPAKPQDMGSQDGDYTWFRQTAAGGTAGYLYKTTPFEAIYVLWDGSVVAGPLTTVEQVNAMTQMLSNQMAAEHELRAGIMANFPSGASTRPRYRIYDSNGNYVRTE